MSTYSFTCIIGTVWLSLNQCPQFNWLSPSLHNALIGYHTFLLSDPDSTGRTEAHTHTYGHTQAHTRRWWPISLSPTPLLFYIVPSLTSHLFSCLFQLALIASCLPCPFSLLHFLPLILLFKIIVPVFTSLCFQSLSLESLFIFGVQRTLSPPLQSSPAPCVPLRAVHSITAQTPLICLR